MESLADGLRVLSMFSPERSELGVTELARLAGMDKRKTQRLVSTLYALDYLEQDPYSRKYRPGVAVLGLGFSVLDSMDVRHLALPHLRQLLDQHGQSVNLAVHRGTDVMLVECLRGRRYLLSVQMHVGDRVPVHVSSMGKAILAFLPRDERERILADYRFVEHTPSSVTSRQELEEQLQRARRCGYAVNDQESQAGVLSVGAPLLGREGAVVAAINVAMPSVVMSAGDMEELVAPSVVEAAVRISRLLGHGEQAGAEPLPSRGEKP